MKSYLAFFRIRFITSLQYRAAALAGLSTQFFFGFIYIMIYLAFYESNSGNYPMELRQLIDYLWLGQAFYALIYLYHKDSEIMDMIKTGNIAYEMCRPQKIYFKWYIKIYASKIASTLLRCFPVLIISLLLPAPFNLNLPNSLLSFIAFLISLIISSFLIVSMITLFHIITFFTIEAGGVVNMFVVISELFSGLVIPIPFFPKFLKTIVNILPFRYICDLPFRLYSGHIPPNEALTLISMQIIWIIVIVAIGYLLTNKALKKVVVQGG